MSVIVPAPALVRIAIAPSGRLPHCSSTVSSPFTCQTLLVITLEISLLFVSILLPFLQAVRRPVPDSNPAAAGRAICVAICGYSSKDLDS